MECNEKQRKRERDGRIKHRQFSAPPLRCSTTSCQQHAHRASLSFEHFSTLTVNLAYQIKMFDGSSVGERLMSILMTAILASICTIGLIGNGIVLIVGISKRKYRNNVTNCFIMNLSVTDFLFLLISVPLTTYLGLKKIWIFGEFLCKMHIYLAHVNDARSRFPFAFLSFVGAAPCHLLYARCHEHRPLFAHRSSFLVSTLPQSSQCSTDLSSPLDE